MNAARLGALIGVGLALAACKQDAPKPAAPAGGSTAADSSRIGTPGAPAFSDEAGGPRPGRRGQDVPRPPGPDGRGRRGPDDPALTPEQREARREEMRARRDQQRDEERKMYDVDADGKLSDEERAVMREARVAGMLDRIDGDRDGKLTAAELEAAPGRGGRRAPLDFATLDVDQDGFVTVEEMAKAMPERGGRGPRGARGDDSAAQPAPP